jgi:membrane protein
MIKLLKSKKENIKSFISAVILLFQRMDDHHIFLIAAGIAFNILIYLIPMFLVTIYILNLTIGATDLSLGIQNILKDILPPDESTTVFLKTTIDEVYMIFEKSSIAGWLGIVTLIWLSSTLFSSLRTGLNRVFDITTNKVFFIYFIKDILLTIVLAFLIFFSTALFSTFTMPILEILQDYAQGNLPEFMQIIFSKAVLIGLSLISSFIMFFMLYSIVPNKRLPKFVLFLSTLICVVLVEISRNLFSLYVSGFGSFGKFYGTYAILVSMAFWIYYLILIVLISAEISRFIYEVKKLN